MQPTEPIPRAVDVTRPAGLVSALAQAEARRLQHHYLGPEHLLLGLLRHGDNLAARVLVAHGLDLETATAEVDRLIAEGVLPGPQPSDAELLASIGIDLETVSGRLKETFGHEAYWQATQRVRLRRAQPASHRAPRDPPRLICARAMNIAAHEAIARDQDVGPEHLLLGLLGDAEDPVETEPYPVERRLRGQVGLPSHGAHAIRLLVEARGLTLATLRAAILSELDRDRDQHRDGNR
ncbi:MAG TPA: Clp protease N-terminal domain-containing protein [Actinomycetes bacterium]|jgi:ATP-dependent Clp protease ATP-binding subunit ClpA|nr:Clp protease N-terminal domain-containing protein [Actinomycetes bacterium]